MATKSDERRTVHYTGHVQGVGFRYTTHSIASGYSVHGYVRNMPDGRVELVAEGAPREVEAFLAGIRERLGSFIRDERIDIGSATGEFSGFEICH